MIDIRPNWDEYFLDICEAVGKRASCPSLKVGAVIVDPETMSIRATGYNGSARGAEHCPKHDRGSVDCKAIHAETNILTNCALNGVSTKGCWLYLTCNPCAQCAPNIVNAGVVRVVCAEYYRTTDAIFYLEENGVEVLVYG